VRLPHGSVGPYRPRGATNQHSGSRPYNDGHTTQSYSSAAFSGDGTLSDESSV